MDLRLRVELGFYFTARLSARPRVTVASRVHTAARINAGAILMTET